MDPLFRPSPARRGADCGAGEAFYSTGSRRGKCPRMPPLFDRVFTVPGRRLRALMLRPGLVVVLLLACSHRGSAPVATPPVSHEGDGDAVIDGPYQPPPEASASADVPHGRVENFEWANSTIFPGTTRPVAVYIPAQYQAGSEAALMVLQDGPSYLRNFKMDVVLDHLI